ncbi:hypothetical protein GCM10009801_46540 [Streptomyces albiaxialis]|uniref:Uncharacterized protein n=1 Tax=Streptomyces albiaxialis TaxID=329523 RepID=A0ABN2W7G9_9ACTN
MPPPRLLLPNPLGAGAAGRTATRKRVAVLDRGRSCWRRIPVRHTPKSRNPDLPDPNGNRAARRAAEREAKKRDKK